MVGIDSSNSFNTNYAAAANAANEVWRMMKKEEKKGKDSKIMQSIKDFHLAHKKVKEELASALSKEAGLNVEADSELIDNIVFSLSLDRLFENRDGEIALSSELKETLQLYDSESLNAREAIAHKLSEGSRQRVPANDRLIDKDIDEISLRTVENPDLLFN